MEVTLIEWPLVLWTVLNLGVLALVIFLIYKYAKKSLKCPGRTNAFVG